VIRKDSVMPLKNLPMKGNYTLLVLLSKEIRLRIPKLGYFNLQKGYYAYTGSAVGDASTSLRRRVSRHLKKRKAKHWHIDFLLANKNSKITAVVTGETCVNKECQVNNLIKSIRATTLPIVGFGASDCKENCRSHLLYCGEENHQREIVDAYIHVFGQKSVSSLSDFQSDGNNCT
jgi:Uri superfamily endonuclease